MTPLYLIEEVGAFCKLWPEGVLSPVNPEISGEGLARQYVRGGPKSTRVCKPQTVMKLKRQTAEKRIYLREEVVLLGNLIKHFMRLYSWADIPL